MKLGSAFRDRAKSWHNQIKTCFSTSQFNSKLMADKIKKGTLVRAVREKLENSLEATASDNQFPAYIFESKGEIVEISDEYALVKFYVPTPNIWFRLDQLEAVK